MGRLIFLALIIVLAFALWRWLVFRFARPPAPKGLETELVRCERCGTHVPRDMAVQAQALWYCREHAPPGEDG